MVISNTSREDLERCTQEWKDRFQRFGLRLNVSKSEFLESGQQTDSSVSVDGQSLRKVTVTKYLGSCLSADGSPAPDVAARSASAWLKWKETTGVLCDKLFPRRLKSMVYKTMVRPVAIYGAECRPATKSTDQTLNVMEMNMLRWSLGVTRLDHIPNQTVRDMLGVRPISEKAAERRLNWYGHIRRSVTSIARRALDLIVPGVRPRGRPRMRWIDTVRRDMAEAGLTDADASDRLRWKALCKKADPVI